MKHRIQPIRPEDIHSLSDFQRNAKTHIERMQKSERPEVLTVNGKAVLVVQDADAYQRLLDLADRMETWLAVREGIESIQRGDGMSLDEFDRELRTKHGLPDRGSATRTQGP